MPAGFLNYLSTTQTMPVFAHIHKDSNWYIS